MNPKLLNYKYLLSLANSHGTIWMDLGDTPTDRELRCQAIAQELGNRPISEIFSSLKPLQHKDNRTIFCTIDIPTNLVLRHLHREIIKKYRIAPPYRDGNIRQLMSILDGRNLPLNIHRTDIAAFYESLNFDAIIHLLKIDGKIHPNDIILLEQISRQCTHYTKGLPRGLGLSAGLSELAMHPIDLQIKQQPGTLMYCRFVDDILIVTADSKSESHIRLLLLQLLHDRSLIINTKKTQTLIWPTKPKIDNWQQKWSYLGYRFTYFHKMYSVGICNKKLAKVYRRLARSFRSFQQHRNSKLLKDQVSILTKTISFYDKALKRRRFIGLQINYRLANPEVYKKILTKLDGALHYYIRKTAAWLQQQNLPQLAKAIVALKKLSFGSKKVGPISRPSHHRMTINRILSAKRKWR